MSNGLILDIRELGYLHDYSRNHHTLTNHGSTSIRGKYGKGRHFDGTDDYISIGDLVTNINSIALWMKPDSIAVTEEIVDLNGTAYLKATSGVLSAEGFTSPTIYLNAQSGVTALSTNWNFIVVTTGTAIDANDVDIGRLESSTYFDGEISSLRLWSRVLTAAEISDMFISKGYTSNLVKSPVAIE